MRGRWIRVLALAGASAALVLTSLGSKPGTPRASGFRLSPVLGPRAGGVIAGGAF